MSPQDAPASPGLLSGQIQDFRNLCEKRYQFNNRFDIALTTAGISMGIAVVAAGTFKKAELGAILGAVITAIVSAQRAFPFAQRAQFYRSLIGQSESLKSSLEYGLTTTTQAVNTLKTLRLDFAQQLPRGTTADAQGKASEQAPLPDAPASTTAPV